MGEKLSVHWTQEPLTRWLYRVTWLVTFALIVSCYLWSPLSFALLIAAMLTSTTLRVVILEVEAGI